MKRIMNLYIEIENGKPKNHPAFEDNLIQAFGRIPDNWEAFTRVKRPTVSVYEILDSEEPEYQKVDGIWKDVWLHRQMTDAEKIEKQQNVIFKFNSRPQAENWSAWTLDESICEMVPPIPRPEADFTKLDAGIRTFWCGADNNWKDTPAYPNDGKSYDFDFLAWNWVEVLP